MNLTSYCYEKIIMFGLIFILCNSIYGQNSEFYEKAISRLKCRNCYFIPINIESKAYSGKVVVNNYFLFSYLKSVKGFDEKAYKSFMVKLFQGNQPLKMIAVTIDESGSFLVGKDLEKHSFRIVKTSQQFETISSQGCKQIIKYYFSPTVIESETNRKSSCQEMLKFNAKDVFIKPKFDLKEQNNVISKLFEMEIPIYLDDISGSLKIGYHTLN